MKFKIKRFFGVALRVVPFALVAAVLLSVAFYPKKKAAQGEQKRVVRVWNVDTFEGGKGSRTSFLKRVAASVEKTDGGLYYLISSYTLEGARQAYADGIRPDLLSYGIGLSVYTESCLPLPYRFAGGGTTEGCLAYPWCKGSYYLFSLTDDFESEGTCALSSGGNNLVEVAAAVSGIGGETVDSLSAYVAFLNGGYRYLLGTQRDVNRFSARGKEVYRKELTGYCDLYQYVSVLSAEKRVDCMKFVGALLSEEVQNRLSDIGMLSVRQDETRRTASVFSDENALSEMRRAAGQQGDRKNLDKFLKNV